MKILEIKSNKNASGFISTFEVNCYEDILRLSRQNFGGSVSWSNLNLFFSRKYRFTKEMTRMLVKQLSRKYPITYNKFGVRCENNGK